MLISFGQESKDVKHMNHDIHYNFGHVFCRPEFDICLESDEEPFDPFEYVGNCGLDSANSHNNLKDMGVNAAGKHNQRGAHRK